MMNLEDLKHIGQKGRGYFCIVRKFSDTAGENFYACKELKKEHYAHPDYKRRLKREIKYLKQLKGCENIVELLGHGENDDKKHLYYLMPFSNQNLYDLIKKNNSILTQVERYSIAQQVIGAIKYAHQRGIIHRDISPRNVLTFTSGSTITVKVSDFGLGKSADSLSHYSGSSGAGYGTLDYVSPEQRIKLNDATERSDIYGLGRLVYFIFTGKDPSNYKVFELSTLVNKATQEDPALRHENITQFEDHFLMLKKLHLEESIPLPYLTLHDVLSSDEEIEFMKLHELLVKGNCPTHPYTDYLKPLNKYFKKPGQLKEYINEAGPSIVDFVETYTARVKECLERSFDFDAMSTFSMVLRTLITTVKNDSVRLACIKCLWYVAFDGNRFDAQRDLQAMLNEKYISPSMEVPLSEFFIQNPVEIDMDFFADCELPKVVKVGLVKSIEKNKKIKKEQQEMYNSRGF